MINLEITGYRVDTVGEAIRQIRKMNGLTIRKVSMRLLEADYGDLALSDPEKYENKVMIEINNLSRFERGVRKGTWAKKNWTELMKALSASDDQVAAMLNTGNPDAPAFLILKEGLLKKVAEKMKKELLLSSLNENAAVERLCRKYLDV
jgi:transcriptional regulator with XRE-family HTH domain|tara:strand:- start:739 stop:1185 length:447 start_codon:yes stop_codon:yes gene_type:complete